MEPRHTITDFHDQQSKMTGVFAMVIDFVVVDYESRVTIWLGDRGHHAPRFSPSEQMTQRLAT